MAGLPLPAAADDPSSVVQLFFFATHVLTDIDERLLRHYSLQLRDSAAALWVLLYRQEAPSVAARSAARPSRTRAVSASTTIISL